VTEDFPRSCVFIGTTNNEEPLDDEENRRYLPVACVQGNIDWIRSNRDQLWAEAVARYRGWQGRPEPWWTVDPKMLTACQEQQEDASQLDPWEEILEEKLSVPVWRTEATTEDCRILLDIKKERFGKSEQMRIGRILRRLGFARDRTRPRINGRRPRCYVRPRSGA
jgi:putative DNA primase/helicase